jgi:hypothetical protein
MYVNVLAQRKMRLQSKEAMDFPEVRKFLLTTYHDLPNVLFMGSLILGSIMGYLPLVWVALGMILNGAATAGAQLLLKFLMKIPFIGKFEKQFQVGSSDYAKCFVGYSRTVEGTIGSLTSSSAGNVMIAPSHWMSASAFFAVFSIYNSIRVMIRDPKGGASKADPQLVSTRKAFSISTLIMGLVFLLLVGARAFTGCETIAGGTLGVLVGLGVAIGYWHLLDGCGTGKIPDVLQVVGSMAPEKNRQEQPVMCVAPKA